MTASARSTPSPFENYHLAAAYDEMFARDGGVRPHYDALLERLSEFPPNELHRRKQAADLSLLQQGVTFTVYEAEGGTERILPHDLLPRVLPAAEWRQIERGLHQRIVALNHFLNDIYHDEHILKDGIVPRDLVYSCPHYRREMQGIDVRRGVYIHVTGSDLIRGEDGRFAVLEDNLRVPSGVSYMLTNRSLTKRILPNLLRDQGVRPIDHYPRALLRTLLSLTPRAGDECNVVVLTPGVHNSAYYEHALLSREMGVELVEGLDLLVVDNVVYMRTTAGLRRVDVIYRRLDDDYLDPVCFRAGSRLGVPGLFHAYRAGNVTLANAIGTGVADDKAVYAFVPAIIRYYLGEDPILPNVETFLCHDAKQRDHVLANIGKLVVKAVGEAGGYGMLIGPHSTSAEQEAFRQKILASPRNYIAQPTIQLSQAPCFIDGQVSPRHIDLRPFVLYGDRVEIVPGGLTRVALREGSLVVNSSQGGGSKDTWVLDDPTGAS